MELPSLLLYTPIARDRGRATCEIATFPLRARRQVGGETSLGGSQMSRKFFGTDGVRGMANETPLDPQTIVRLGMAVGAVFANGGHSRVVIGKDTRLSGYMIEQALTAGFLSVGLDVFLLGPVPTPGVAMLTRSLRADLGVMISASHNPYHDNGIKFFDPNGEKLSDEQEKRIEVLLESDLSRYAAKYDKLGRAKRIEDAQARYIEFIKRSVPRHFRLDGLRIVIDCANGAAYKIAPTALWELGAEIYPIGVEPNGTNINAGCGSTNCTLLQQKVHEHRADIGIALDGDADRVLIVDEKGKLVDGDQILALIATHMQQRGQLSGDGVVATIMSNLGLERFLESRGLKLHRAQVGDRYVAQMMREKGCNVGGEQSGHIILTDYNSTGDGLIAALQLLLAVREQECSVSEACHLFDPVPQVMENVRIDGGHPLEDAKVQEAIAEAETELQGWGRLVIRPSGTEPVIRIMVEGDDEMRIRQIAQNLASLLRRKAA